VKKYLKQHFLFDSSNSGKPVPNTTNVPTCCSHREHYTGERNDGFVFKTRYALTTRLTVTERYKS